MFIDYNPTIPLTLSCSKPVSNLQDNDFRYFDKDGFELNIAEQKFYKAMGYNLDNGILNHICWEDHIIGIYPNDKFFLDHSMVLYRCNYINEAKSQLEQYSKTYPFAATLLQAKQKWGYDFDLNCLSSTGQIFEVLHIEFDSNDYTSFIQSMAWFKHKVFSTDWEKVSDEIWYYRNEWLSLKGYQQNHWKAKYILGWEESEVLEKVLG